MRCAWIILLGSLHSATAWCAPPLYYEPFDYAEGEDALSATDAWASIRFVGSEADVIAGSLSYVDAAGAQLRTSGAKVLVDTADESQEVRHRVDLDISAHQGPVLWVSLLGEQTAGDAMRFINIAFMTPDDILQPPDGDSDEDEAFSVGVSSSSSPSGWSVFNRSQTNGRQVAQSMVPTTKQSLLLVRIEPNVGGGEAERYTLWVNPMLGVAPPESDGLSIVSVGTDGMPASDFNVWSDLIAMRIGAGTARNGLLAASWMIDDIRIGADWADVLPWSPGLELLAPLPEPGPNGCVVTWRPAPARTDVVESSLDSKIWVPHEASRHVGQPGETSVSFVVPPPPAGTTSMYVRVRRDP